MRCPEADTKEMGNSYLTLQACLPGGCKGERDGAALGQPSESAWQREGIQMLVHKIQLNRLQ